MESSQQTVGDVLRGWRQRRRLSQLDLALEAGVSPRHVSFLETGRSRASREMLGRLADSMEIPLRERNALFVAGGFTPMFRERSFHDPDLEQIRRALDLILEGHAPNPALVVNRHWNLVTANPAVDLLLGLVEDRSLLEPPVNVMRACLAPGGLPPRLMNLRDLRHHFLHRLRHEYAVSGDSVLGALIDEMQSLPAPKGGAMAKDDFGGVAVRMVIRTDVGVLSFISTTTVFGTATDVTVDELTIESFFPMDQATAVAMEQLVIGLG